MELSYFRYVSPGTGASDAGQLPSYAWILIFQVLLDTPSLAAFQILPRPILRQLIRVCCNRHASEAAVQTCCPLSYRASCEPEDMPHMHTSTLTCSLCMRSCPLSAGTAP